MGICVYSCAMRSYTALLCCFPLALAAQHCGYDFASVIVVRPHAEGDSAVIDGLRITLLDSNNVPLVRYDHPVYRFHGNTDRAALADGLFRTQEGFGTFEGRACAFPFAHDNYVLVVPNGLRTETLKVLVQDERDVGPQNKQRDQWPVRFKQQVVPLTAFDSYHLCGVYDEDVYPAMHDRAPFHPVDIILQPR